MRFCRNKDLLILKFFFSSSRSSSSLLGFANMQAPQGVFVSFFWGSLPKLVLRTSTNTWTSMHNPAETCWQTWAKPGRNCKKMVGQIWRCWQCTVCVLSWGGRLLVPKIWGKLTLTRMEELFHYPIDILSGALSPSWDHLSGDDASLSIKKVGPCPHEVNTSGSGYLTSTCTRGGLPTTALFLVFGSGGNTAIVPSHVWRYATHHHQKTFFLYINGIASAIYLWLGPGIHFVIFIDPHLGLLGLAYGTPIWLWTSTRLSRTFVSSAHSLSPCWFWVFHVLCQSLDHWKEGWEQNDYLGAPLCSHNLCLRTPYHSPPNHTPTRGGGGGGGGGINTRTLVTGAVPR